MDNFSLQLGIFIEKLCYPKRTSHLQNIIEDRRQVTSPSNERGSPENRDERHRSKLSVRRFQNKILIRTELGESHSFLPDDVVVLPDDVVVLPDDVAVDVATLTLCRFRQTTSRQLLEPEPTLWHSHLKQLKTIKHKNVGSWN